MSSQSYRDACLATLTVHKQTYQYWRLPLAAQRLGNLDRLPKSLKILLENLLRHLDGDTVQEADLQALADWQRDGHADREITFHPARVLMQDFTGVPAVVDLAAMRDAVQRLGGQVSRVNPLTPVDLVIDHSVTVDHFGDEHALVENTRLEMTRNHERYAFLRWGQKAFRHFRVVPPGTGICHQVNLEYLAKAVWSRQQDDVLLAYPDTLVGTDSHTTMINGLGVLGWGVGGIEAEAAMLGQPVSMLIPDVVGVRLSGKLREGITATDLVLTVTQMLRQHGVVGKFVEFFGDGLDHLPLADRATLANMAPEYGATCGFFPIDDITLDYLRLTNRGDEQVALVEAYCREQGLWRHPGDEPRFSSVLELDMASVETSLAGPKRPQDRVTLAEAPGAFNASRELELTTENRATAASAAQEKDKPARLAHGAVVIAAITSCTNTSNPSVLIAAGLLARNAVARGLKVKPWVKTSLAPGSRVVSDYLELARLTEPLAQLGFHLVGYGCTTCIGNSGPLPEAIESAIREDDLTVAAVLSGNRNFEGRIHPLVKTNWLASPPLVVAYALAGNMSLDLTRDPLGEDAQGQPVYLRDIWPSADAVADTVQTVSAGLFSKAYASVFDGTPEWQAIEVGEEQTYHWPVDSTYIRRTPFFDDMQKTPAPVQDIRGAHILAMLGDSVTTDHISPAGSIRPDSPAGRYLQDQGVAPPAFNAYGARRGNHEVMMRGTFANVRIRNDMVPGKEGGFTRHVPSQEVTTIYDAAVRYREQHIPLAVIAGKEYGSGSSRDWAAKGPRLLGVRVVIAESFERIHRSNLIGMGILPLEFLNGESRKTLHLTGDERIEVLDLSDLTPGATVAVTITRPDGESRIIQTRCRIDIATELTYFRHDGILHYVIRRMLGDSPHA
ncbi:aconitate hydratase AcnA [Dickeya fangzhongdai]|uniref:Aconitate hydratase n=1 Tax=Dickeya fangzhongdai TaxID=1778540 RepID=A0A2K8QN78_9GAMM|nr:aconitate hydratase AcnA [Dickeya fangzhongdai]ATZ94852.1 aconitate hydratase AcnA [Dickeya fangzhongdai]QOH48293.1 aconitate hydratase AcnA [Dickeya fangzhongdai]QOH52596.1 aconitate hydratase AcnA [Dickeya fangzhongdai]WOY00203.1 aconitate hydratase AcnA [Dickeya fangzhongdai]GGB95667.1 aconitate hydratase [Dickeya fangzhongdai]